MELHNPARREADAAIQDHDRRDHHDRVAAVARRAPVRVALRESGDAEEQAELAARMDALLRSAEDLLDGLLDVLRPTPACCKPQWSDFDAVNLLRELHAQYRRIAAQRGIVVACAGRDCPVRSDRRLLRRALQNFLQRDALHPRRRRLLVAAAAATRVPLRVWDTGPGIPPRTSSRSSRFRRYDQPGEARPTRPRPRPVDLPAHLQCSTIRWTCALRRSAAAACSIRVGRAARALPLPPARPGSVRPTPRWPACACCAWTTTRDPGRHAGPARPLAGRRALRDHRRWRAGSGRHHPEVLLVDYHLHDRLMAWTPWMRCVPPAVPSLARCSPPTAATH